MVPMLRETLYDWFLSVRSAVATRIPPKVVRMKADALATSLVQEMGRTGEFLQIPKIDESGWLRRWKRDYNVSLRKPNKRYKCNRPTLRGRLRAMWVTNARIRALALYCLGRELDIWGFDQKGIYMNHAGSKNTGTLSIDGCPDVALKENHAATRTRVSLMTSVVSSRRALAEWPAGLPLEILFKGTNRILGSLDIPPSANVSRA